jgi:hypothetical protein
MAPRSAEARTQLVATYDHGSLYAFFNKNFVLLREWHLEGYHGRPKYGESSHYPKDLVFLKPWNGISDHEVKSLEGLRNIPKRENLHQKVIAFCIVIRLCDALIHFLSGLRTRKFKSAVKEDNEIALSKEASRMTNIPTLIQRK